MSYLLVSLIVLPIVGALVGGFVPARSAKTWALLVSLLVAGCAAGLAASFNFHQDLSTVGANQRMSDSVQIDFASKTLAVREIGFSFHVGIDAISLWLVLLTTLLMPLAIAASFGSIKAREREYYAWMLALLGAMLGVFIARDLLLFYVFFELTLIPMFFIIAIWGGPERRFAAAKFFLFTFAGSVFLLAGVAYLGLQAQSFDLHRAIYFAQTLSPNTRYWLFVAFLLGFAVKVPLFPVHTWLPLAHTEAPTAGSVILAGVLLKLGTYGLLRLAIPVGVIGLAPTAVYAHIGSYEITVRGFVGFLASLCVIGIIYGALVAWVQRDIKKLVAYSSVSHLGFCVLGLFALNAIGMQGSILYMINHGLSTGALFLVIGMIYDRYHTRDIDQLSGLARIMPKLAFFFVFFALSSIGLPGLNGFPSEFMTVLGAFTSDRWLGIPFGAFAALGVILGAVYMLHMLARVLFGPVKVPVDHDAHDGQHEGIQPDSHQHGHGPRKNDINGREIAILIPLAICCLVLGMPVWMMRTMTGPIQLIQTVVPAPGPQLRMDDDRTVSNDPSPAVTLNNIKNP